MNAPIAYGIDFGTTNTLLSVATEDSVDLLAIDGASELLPSLVYLHRKPLRSAGQDAVRQYVLTARNRTRCGHCSLVDYTENGAVTKCRAYQRDSGYCFDSRMISEIKRALADTDRESTHSWARDFDFPDLVAIIFRELKRRADRAVGCNVSRVVIGHPVAFEGATGTGFAKKQRLAKARLKMAAEHANFTDVRFLEEPSAATLLEADEGTVLSADFGGGTFDVSIIELTSAAGHVRALSGATVGGADLDGKLFRHTMFAELGLAEGGGARRIPNRYRTAFSRRDKAVRVLGDAEFTHVLSDLRREGGLQGSERLQRLVDNAWVHDLYDAVEHAKCELSQASRTRIRFDRPGVDIDVDVTRSDFEGWITRELQLVRKALQDALDQAQLTPGDVDLVACTGGSSQLPAFKNVLVDMFGAGKVHEREPYSAIALGLGLHARRLWHE